MDMQGLLVELDRLATITNEQWLRSLDQRKHAELEFHNRHRDSKVDPDSLPQDTYEKFYGNRKYYSATSRSKDYVDNWIRAHAADRVVLDYACGNGANALKAARAGAALAIGLDISDVSIANARRAAAEEQLTANTYFIQADAENTKLPSSSIDTIICSGMLHHLDLSFALPELRRILKPGGKILAVEALDYNPLIKLYRRMTPAMRTEWEMAHILSLQDVEFAGRFFDIGEVKYWHIVGYAGGKLPTLLPTFDLIDRALERLPLVQRLAWIFTFELVGRRT